jgi:rubrerythrin
MSKKNERWSMAQKVLLASLKRAIDMERRGQKFYNRMSGKCLNESTKKMFAFLAGNELQHIESIREFYETMRKEGAFPRFHVKETLEQRKEYLKIFSEGIRKLDEKIKPGGNDREACEFALEFENNGYRYYEKMLKKAKDKNLIKLLRFLLREESTHYASIENLHTYLVDPHNWFMYDEGSFPQGG